MNLTLSIDGNLLREARKVALEMDTSVNSLVREYLKTLVHRKRQEEDRFLSEWERLMKEFPVDMNGRTWSRDELHERRYPGDQ